MPGSHQMLMASSGDGIAERKTIGSMSQAANALVKAGSTPPAGKTRHRNPEPRSAWAGCQCSRYRSASAEAIWAESSALAGSLRPALLHSWTMWSAAARSSGEPRWTWPSSGVDWAATAGPGPVLEGGGALLWRSWPSISTKESRIGQLVGLFVGVCRSGVACVVAVGCVGGCVWGGDVYPGGSCARKPCRVAMSRGMKVRDCEGCHVSRVDRLSRVGAGDCM